MTPAQLELLERDRQQAVERRPERIMFGDLDQRRAIVEADDRTAGSGRPGVASLALGFLVANELRRNAGAASQVRRMHEGAHDEPQTVYGSRPPQPASQPDQG